MDGVKYKKRKKAKSVYDFWTHQDGLRLLGHHRMSITTAFPPGCGVATLRSDHLHSLRDLGEDILRKLPSLIPWGDGWVDRKSRGYATLPDQSNWKDVGCILEEGIVMHDADAALSPDLHTRQEGIRKHKKTVEKSFVSMYPPPNQLDAIQCLIDHVNIILRQSENASQLKPYERNAVHMANLVAIQPNFHNGDDYLPLHLDNPRHDGFGVVIVTVALWGSGDIVLVDDGDGGIDHSHRDGVSDSFESEVHVGGVCSTATKTTEHVLGSVICTNNSTHDSDNHTHSTMYQDRDGYSGKNSYEHNTDNVTYEGGIVFKDGKFSTVLPLATTTTEPAVAEDDTIVTTQSISTLTTTATNPLHTITATSTATAIATADNTYIQLPTTTTDEPIQPTLHTIDSPTTIANNIHSEDSTNLYSENTHSNTNHSANGNNSMSWSFPLSPGQLYVLSGPARNKCAHGVVVHREEAPVNTKSLSMGYKRRKTSAMYPTDTTSTSIATSPTNITSITIANNTTIANSDAAVQTSDSTTVPVPVPVRQQPRNMKGRVSLNFRFGLHSKEQAWEDIDSHWG